MLNWKLYKNGKIFPTRVLFFLSRRFSVQPLSKIKAFINQLLNCHALGRVDLARSVLLYFRPLSAFLKRNG